VQHGSEEVKGILVDEHDICIDVTIQGFFQLDCCVHTGKTGTKDRDLFPVGPG
jgi:hypothetical protein